MFKSLVVLISAVIGEVEFHKVRMSGGATFLEIEVQNAEANPQSLLFDTGSTHTYLLNHKMLKDVPRAKRASVAGMRPKGYRKSVISPKSVVTADGDRVDFAGFQGLILEKWTSKKFTLGKFIWSQRFAVARLPPSEHQIHDPRDSGLIGASPGSRFARTHPQFGFIAREMDKEFTSVEFFMSNGLETKWCVNDVVAYTPVVDTDFWLMKGGMKLGDDIITTDFKFLVDSGCGLIALPEPFFTPVKRLLQAAGVVWETGFTYGQIPCNKVHQLPPIHIEIETGFTITILPEFYATAYFMDYCQVYISQKKINLDWMTFGEPLVRYLGTEFDKTKNRMGFCESLSSRDPEGTPLVRPTVAGETFKRTNRRTYRNRKNDPVVIQDPPRIPTHFKPAGNTGGYGGYGNGGYGNGGYGNGNHWNPPNYRDFDDFGFGYGYPNSSSIKSLCSIILVIIVSALL